MCGRKKWICHKENCVIHILKSMCHKLRRHCNKGYSIVTRISASHCSFFGINHKKDRSHVILQRLFGGGRIGSNLRPRFTKSMSGLFTFILKQTLLNCCCFSDGFSLSIDLFLIIGFRIILIIKIIGIIRRDLSVFAGKVGIVVIRILTKSCACKLFDFGLVLLWH